MNKSFFHVLGGSLIVAGTAIGAGMLALPIVTAAGGFFPALCLYLLAWVVMTSTGLLFLELCLYLPKDSNLSSMAQTFLGKSGKVITWIIYLFLFYALSVAYLTGASMHIKEAFSSLFSTETGIILFLIIAAFFVYRGTRSVEKINSLLMFGLILSYFAFVIWGAHFIQVDFLKQKNWPKIFWGMPVLLLSFGYQGVVPSLSNFFKKDVKKMRLCIFIGTTIALFVYLIWEMLILGMVPLEDLLKAQTLEQTAVIPLKQITKIPYVFMIGQFFSFFAISTSFLGVTLGIFDFLSDGLKIEKKGFKKLLIAAFTFLPSLLFALTFPDLFLTALNYAAGVGGTLLLVFFPALLVWIARYHKKSKIKSNPQVFGGKYFLVFLFLIVIVNLFLAIAQKVI